MLTSVNFVFYILLLLYYYISLYEDEEFLSSPRVKGRAILEGTVVVVADVISSLRPAGAAFRHLLHLHDQIILRVEDVNQQHIKHQSSLRRD